MESNLQDIAIIQWSAQEDEDNDAERVQEETEANTHSNSVEKPDDQ